MVEAFTAAMTKARGTFEEREAKALSLGNELVRRWIEQELQAMADQFGEEVVVAGERYRRHDRGARRYHTLCGAVVVSRASYRLVGIHNGPTIVPLELRAGLNENATPALAFSVTQGFAERPLRHYEMEMAAAHRHTPSRSTLERIGKRIGDAIESTIVDVEPEVRAAEPVAEGVRSISVGLDRTTVPMAEVIALVGPRAPRIRRPSPPIEVAYRMAYVGTVSTHDREGRVIATKRFAATPNDGPEVLLERMGGELHHLRRRHGALPISVVQDGAPELWNLVEQLREQTGLALDIEVIDRFHVDERLAAMCECLGVAGWGLRNAWQSFLDRSDSAVDRIIRRLDELMWHCQLGSTDGDPPPKYWSQRGVVSLTGPKIDIISGHLEYLRNNRGRIRYATSLRRGLPIGSGATEGACKSVVTMRFKRSGQRWFESGLAPCLSLRALHLSERLRPCFAKLQVARFASLEAA
jgi:hypothetical protein